MGRRENRPDPADDETGAATRAGRDGPLTRRRALVSLGAVGAGLLVAACGRSGSDAAGGGQGSSTTGPGATGGGSADGAASPSTTRPGAAPGTSGGPGTGTACTVTPELTEGPYYLDLDLVRRDITEGRAGAPLRLAVRAVKADGCTPLADAAVDVWHCDAGGSYSGVGGGGGGGRRPSGGAPGGSGSGNGGAGTTYLRGTQVTDADGNVEFLTVYPGWYSGRAVHIHLKVHPDASREMTTQLFFPDDFTAQVYLRDPYRQRGNPDVKNADDSIYAEDGGATLLEVQPDGTGYRTAITVTVGGGSSRRNGAGSGRSGRA